MFWLPCLLPFALLYKVLEYIYNFVFSKPAEKEVAACPFSKKTAAEGVCPASKSNDKVTDTTEPAQEVTVDSKKDQWVRRV